GRFITTNPARSRCSTRRRVLWITEIASFFASQAQLLAKPKTLNRRNSPKSAAILIASGQNPTLGTHAGRSQKGGLLPSKGRPGRVGLRPERTFLFMLRSRGRPPSDDWGRREGSSTTRALSRSRWPT